MRRLSGPARWGRAALAVLALLLAVSPVMADEAAAPRAWVAGWRSGPPMQTPRSGAAAVAVDGVIHLIGGVDGKGFLRSSEYIRVGPGGELSAWRPGPALNEARGFFSAVRHGGFVYAVGGGQGDYGKILLDSVERARVRPDGTLARWALEPFRLNVKRRCAKLAVIGNHLYVFGGFSGILLDSVERAEIRSDGSLGEWLVLTDTMQMARYIHAVKRVGERIYMIGGHDKAKGVGIAGVEWSREDDEGWLEPWRDAAPLQTGRYGLAAVRHGDYLYAIGGLDGAAYLESVEKAQINPDGSLGGWRFTTPLESPREGASALVVNDRLYLIGGTNLSGYKRSVEYAAFNASGDIGHWATPAEAAARAAALRERQRRKAVLPNEAVVVSHIKAARYSYLEVQRDDGLVAWLAGPVADLPVGTRIRFPNGVIMRHFYSKELKRDFPVIMFVGELRRTAPRR